VVRWAYNPFTNNLDEVGISGPAGGGTPGDIAVFDASGNLADSGFAFPLTVPGGGTGDIGFTPFAVVTGGTTSTSNLQNVSGLGLATQVLTSNGPGLLPTWQAGGGGGGSVSTLTGNSGGAISPTANNINTVGTGSITIAGAGSTLTTQLTGLTNHDVLVGAGTATITSVAPSATSGVPLISQGAAADPVFGTAVVAGGGTGDTSFTAYSVITGGTTSTGNLQNVSGLGSSGNVLTSNGAGALPTWQAAAATGISTLTGNSGGAISPSAGNVNTVGTGSITIVGSGSTLTTELTGLTNHNVLIGAGSATITNVAPSATSGVPLISQGAAADPIFGTATVPGGGTGAVTLTIHGVLLGEGTGAIVATTAGSTGQVLMGAAGADPAFTSTPTFAGASTFTGSVTLNGGLIEKLTTTAVSYQVLVTDVIIGVTDTTAARTITMPNSGLVAGQRWTIKDQSGGAATHAITIAGNGANIDGIANQVINGNYDSVDIYTDSSNFFLV
jgi:hypothetical protein